LTSDEVARHADRIRKTSNTLLGSRSLADFNSKLANRPYTGKERRA